MATGGITTLPTVPEDGASSTFPPGGFKEPKRLYCKNGGYFLRINADGRVDGIREKNDPYIKLQLQAESIGVITIKGVCANRYLAMNEDGRLFGSDPGSAVLNVMESLDTLARNPNEERITVIQPGQDKGMDKPLCICQGVHTISKGHLGQVRQFSITTQVSQLLLQFSDPELEVLDQLASLADVALIDNWLFQTII
ncbi:FGF2 factor, partial [Polypterus senegalus]